MARIGFVGLGLMGLPMAQRILSAGHELSVFSANTQGTSDLRENGASVADSLKELVDGIDILCSCRVTPAQSLEVFRAAAECGRANLYCVDFSTVDPGTSRQIANELEVAGHSFLDAPVSGGPDGAAAGSLTIMVGGDASTLARVRPVLEALGTAIFHMGPIGAGVSAKLCNNMITGTLHVLIAEAMVLGVKCGIAPDRLYDLLRSSSARGNTLERVVPHHFLSHDFTPGSALTTMIKDLDCILETGREMGVRLLLPAIAQQCFLEASARGHGAKDLSAVVLPMEEIANVTLKKT